MELIHVQSILFEPLQIDYDKSKLEKRYNNQLNNGFDLLEANIKFIAILLLGILKNENSEAYQKVFSAFRSKSSLGNYYFILLEALSVECDSELFQNIKSILLQKVNLELETASTILFGQNQSKKIGLFLNISNRKPNYKTDSILAYSLDFRNRIKGHSATFKEDEEDYAIRMLKNLDKLLHSLQNYTNQILTIDSFDFYTTSYLETKANLQNHHQHKLRKIIVKFDDKLYEISPMIAYIECDRYTCSLNHRNKIFFINEVENSKSFYLDYLYNHMWRVNTTGSDWDIKSLENNLKELQQEIANNSNEERFNDLSKIFIGREKELDDLENFILNNIEQNSISIIAGKPGVGKSSFITKLQTKLLEKNENILTYIFYSIQGNNGENETKTFISKFRSYLYANDIKLDKIKNQNDEEISEFEQIESTFSSLSKQEKPTIFFIDGLDELQNPIAFLNNLPFASIKENIKLHFIFTTRNYGHITSLLSKKCANQTTLLLNDKENILKNGYSFEIDTLKYHETLELIYSVLPKEFTENSNSKDILDSIVEKSECLPIYIHYICEKIKNLDTITFGTISEVALKLPDKLSEFYFDTFRKVPTLSRKILLIFFFSPYGVSKEELFILLKPDDIDITEFKVKYFNPIEIFLKEDENGYFSFYHLSLKDAIYRYYKDELKEIIEIDSSGYINNIFKDDSIEHTVFDNLKLIDEYNNIFKFIYHIEGDLKNTNEEILHKCIVNIENPRFKNFIFNNLFYLYYYYILRMQISKKQDEKNNEEVRQYLDLFLNFGNKYDIVQIRLCLNLSLIFNKNNFIFKVYDLYKHNNYLMFEKYCEQMTPNAITYFIQNIDSWDLLTGEQKDKLFDLLSKHESLPNDFLKVLSSLDDNFKIGLIDKFSDLDKLFEVLRGLDIFFGSRYESYIALTKLALANNQNTVIEKIIDDITIMENIIDFKNNALYANAKIYILLFQTLKNRKYLTLSINNINRIIVNENKIDDYYDVSMNISLKADLLSYMGFILGNKNIVHKALNLSSKKSDFDEDDIEDYEQTIGKKLPYIYARWFLVDKNNMLALVNATSNVQERLNLAFKVYQVLQNEHVSSAEDFLEGIENKKIVELIIQEYNMKSNKPKIYNEHYKLDKIIISVLKDIDDSDISLELIKRLSNDSIQKIEQLNLLKRITCYNETFLTFIIETNHKFCSTLYMDRKYDLRNEYLGSLMDYVSKINFEELQLFENILKSNIYNEEISFFEPVFAILEHRLGNEQRLYSFIKDNDKKNDFLQCKIALYLKDSHILDSLIVDFENFYNENEEDFDRVAAEVLSDIAERIFTTLIQIDSKKGLEFYFQYNKYTKFYNNWAYIIKYANDTDADLEIINLMLLSSRFDRNHTSDNNYDIIWDELWKKYGIELFELLIRPEYSCNDILQYLYKQKLKPDDFITNIIDIHNLKFINFDIFLSKRYPLQILEHYGVGLEKHKRITKYYELLIEYAEKIYGAKENKDIQLYKRLISEVKDIKNQISDDKELLNEFLTKYNIDEFEFETSNILDIIQTKETL